MKLSVLMPVFNERLTLDDILDRVLRVSLPDNMDIEVVVVDDASTDGSWDIIRKRMSEDRRIHAFRHEINQGKGAAVRLAVERATGDIAVIQDADLEYDPSDYSRLISPILKNEADVVYGSRFQASEYRRVLLFWHTIANKVLTGISNMMTNLNLTDMETCYKAFRMSVIKTIPLRSNRFGIEPEITAKIAKRKLKIFEIPIRYNGRTYLEGKKIGFSDALQALWTILKYSMIDDLYNGRYGEETLRSMELATRFTEWQMRKIAPFLSGTVLEVGAGIGNNIRAMLGCEKLIAAESDPEYVRLLRNAFANRRKVQVIEWDVTRPAPAGLFPVDTVLCSNVLEHVEDEKTALTNIHSILRPGGCLIMVVPAGENRFGGIDTAVGHFRRYEKQSFIKRLEEAGFRADTCFSMNKMGVLGWIINGRILRRNTLGRFQLKLFNMLVPVLRLIDPILPWTGLSLVVVARR